ncbi:MAG: polysaccharide deacetylase family protein [Bacteroidales bacterium]|nr:polysaccharide deacetylase family protein [Bacteroidales bacterium]
MKALSISLFFCLTLICLDCRTQDEIRLIVRGDDIGSTHAANLGCIQSYQEGIMRSVEIMVPCAWFPEAVRMLNENPGLDVGVHLTFTSEWENVKWRPLTHAPGITDEDGYFYPMIWPNDRFPENQVLKGAGWKLEEIEAEMRAQIEMAIRHIPQVSHLSCHMGCSGWNDEVAAVYNKLAIEYDLAIKISDYDVNRFPMERKGETSEQRINEFIDGLNKLEAGKTYLFVEHPALKSTEMEAVGHEGYFDVNEDRQMVTEMFTSEKVMKVIQQQGIQLISYADLTR